MWRFLASIHQQLCELAHQTRRYAAYGILCLRYDSLWPDSRQAHSTCLWWFGATAEALRSACEMSGAKRPSNSPCVWWDQSHLLSRLRPPSWTSRTDWYHLFYSVLWRSLSHSKRTARVMPPHISSKTTLDCHLRMSPRRPCLPLLKDDWNPLALYSPCFFCRIFLFTLPLNSLFEVNLGGTTLLSSLSMYVKF